MFFVTVLTLLQLKEKLNITECFYDRDEIVGNSNSHLWPIDTCSGIGVGLNEQVGVLNAEDTVVCFNAHPWELDVVGFTASIRTAHQCTVLKGVCVLLLALTLLRLFKVIYGRAWWEKKCQYNPVSFTASTSNATPIGKHNSSLPSDSRQAFRWEMDLHSSWLNNICFSPHLSQMPAHWCPFSPELAASPVALALGKGIMCRRLTDYHYSI